MHADTIYSDLAVREFVETVGPLFDPYRREMTLLQSKIIEAVRQHKSTNELQRRLVLAKCLQLVGA